MSIMKVGFVWSGLWGLMVGLCGFAFAGTEYVSNGSFESVTDGNPDGWTKVYTEGEISQDVARSGKNSFKLASHAEKATGVLTEIKGFSSGATLQISSCVYVKSFESGILKPIHLAFTSQGKTSYRHINLFPRDTNKYRLNEWTRFTYDLDLSAYPDVDSIRVYSLGWEYKALGESFVGEVFVDDLSVVEK